MKNTICQRFVSILLLALVVCGCGMTAAASADWDEAYAAYLRDFAKRQSDNYDMSQVKFDLAYIGADDAPELLISLGTSHHSEIEIVTFSEGEAEQVGQFYASGGAIEYYKGKGVICSTGSSSGDGWNYFYQIVTTTYKKLDHFRCTTVLNSDGSAAVDNYGKPVFKYTINEKEVTQSEYDKQLERYDLLYGTRETCAGQYALTETGLAAKLQSAAAAAQQADASGKNAAGKKGQDDPQRARKRAIVSMVLYAIAAVIFALLAVRSTALWKTPRERTQQQGNGHRKAQRPARSPAGTHTIRPPELPREPVQVMLPEPEPLKVWQPEPKPEPLKIWEPKPVPETVNVQQPQQLVWQPEMTTKPTETPKKKKKTPFRYRCSESDHGGECEMCGIDVGILMQIDAIKGEKVNTRYFCRNCAADIMRKVEQQKDS